MASTNPKLNAILKYIGPDVMSGVEQFIRELVSRNFVTFQSEDQIKMFFNEFMSTFYSKSSYADVENIRYYTGIAFNEVNSILRGVWDYYRSGMLTNEKKAEFTKLAEDLCAALYKVPSSLPTDIRAYRGVSLASFKDYGIHSLQELKGLVGQYYYENAFTSTSLLRDKSFFNRDLEWHDDCDIEIEYFIPRECCEGVPLITDELSYSKVQSEFLINRGSLSKILDVTLSPDGKKAYIKAVLVPQKIWDRSFANSQSINK